MKYSRLFALAIGALAAGLVISTWDFAYSRGISQGQKQLVRMELWGNVIAESINQKPIYLSVDGKTPELLQGGVYMDDRLNLMVPVSLLRDYFYCSSYVQNEDTLVMEQGESTVSVRLNEYTMKMDGVYENLPATMVKRGSPAASAVMMRPMRPLQPCIRILIMKKSSFLYIAVVLLRKTNM